MALVQRVWGLVNSAMTIVGIVQLLRGSRSLSVLVILVAGLAGFLVGALYIWLKKGPGRPGARRRAHAYSARVRRWALAAVVLIPLLAAAATAAWLDVEVGPAARAVVVVADFEGPQASGRQATRFILQQLGRELQRRSASVAVEPLGQGVTASQGSGLAGALGHEREAALVLWGACAAAGERAAVTVHLELTGSPVSSGPPDRLQEAAALGNLGSLSFQTRLVPGMPDLAWLVMGLVSYQEGDWAGAADCFSQGLALPAAPGQVADPVLFYLLRGATRCRQADPGRAVDDLSRAMAWNPSRPETYYFRAVAYRQQGETARAMADLGRALDLAADAQLRALVERQVQEIEGGQ